VTSDGRPAVIEYSDMPADLMHETAGGSGLKYSHGSIAIHILNAAYVSSGPTELPIHTARKKVRVLNPGPGGAEIVDREALKFEMFIFDAIPAAERALFFETERAEEFAPVKNKEGVDSIETCVRGQIEKHSAWLSACGVRVPRDAEGTPRFAVEISPLYAADRAALARRRGELPPEINRDTLLV